MRDLFRRQRPVELTTPEPAPLSASDPWRPINPRDGTPRLILSWVTTEAGSGFAVDTFNIATRQIAEFYLDGGAAIAALVRQPEGEQIDTATAQPATEIPQPGASTAVEPYRTGATQPPARARALIAPSAPSAE